MKRRVETITFEGHTLEYSVAGSGPHSCHAWRAFKLLRGIRVHGAD